MTLEARDSGRLHPGFVFTINCNVRCRDTWRDDAYYCGACLMPAVSGIEDQHSVKAEINRMILDFFYYYFPKYQ
jgi:hypothetical protein